MRLDPQRTQEITIATPSAECPSSAHTGSGSETKSTSSQLLKSVCTGGMRSSKVCPISELPLSTIALIGQAVLVPAYNALSVVVEVRAFQVTLAFAVGTTVVDNSQSTPAEFT